MSAIAFDFSGKVALVTGGSRGIGRATALLFARNGAKVVIGDVNPAGVETVEMIKQERGEAIFIQTDVCVAEQVRNLVATTVKTFGGWHCAFNNAGVLPPMAPLAETEESTFDQTFAVDVKGVFLSMKYEIQQMLQTGGGAIVNNASIARMIAERGISAYVAAKHAVIGLTKAAAILPDLKRDAKGRFTIYIQHDSPGADKESNWLPAPRGPFLCVMRLYWPKPAAGMAVGRRRRYSGLPKRNETHHKDQNERCTRR